MTTAESAVFPASVGIAQELKEKANIDRIVATLGLKEMSQSTLVRKLCTLSGHHRTRKAIFEFNKLIRSIYTLRYRRESQLQRNVHRLQNRIESYHRLRPVLAQVSGNPHKTAFNVRQESRIYLILFSLQARTAINSQCINSPLARQIEAD